MRRMLRFGYVMLVSAVAVHAGSLTLNEVTTVHQYQQATNGPCVIGDPSCKGSLSFATFPSNAGSYESVSPIYSANDIKAIVGNSFFIGVDINQSDVTQTLSLFQMLVNGVVVDTYSASPATLVPPTTGGGNGNGFADYTLTGFSSLASLGANDTIQFHVVMPLVNAGREEFFLLSDNTSATPTSATTPEPISLALVGGGLLGLFLLRRRARQAIS